MRGEELSSMSRKGAPILGDRNCLHLRLNFLPIHTIRPSVLTFSTASVFTDPHIDFTDVDVVDSVMTPGRDHDADRRGVDGN